MYLFAVSPEPGGEITLSAEPDAIIDVTTYSLSGSTIKKSGEEIRIDINSTLLVIVVSEGFSSNKFS